MKITEVTITSHEKVLRVEEPALGLTGFIAVHSTALGPAAGGLRMRPYADEAAALTDALRLSRGMTYKNAAAGLPLGGGKAVILGDPATKTPQMLEAFGRAIDTLEGRYWTAEDMGMSPADMAHVAAGTAYVAGLPDGEFASGDPSPITARGIFNAIRVTARHRLGTDDLSGRRVALQGLGHVGAYLAQMLHEAGARLVVTDMDPARVAQAVADFGAEAVPPEAILAVEADILAPCAVGAVLNESTIPALRVAAVAGGANNQLATPEDAARLQARGILYAPDFVANAGGIINVATEILRIADRETFVAEKLAAAEATLERILASAARSGRSPADLAEEIVDGLLARRAA
ncbi:amino acid dehydrogenase [Defluviimonas sp. 20V17]|uniref:Amino acid dehydrogenase n=1 Tax=Allgaiera indica TaxID=765699 RepID=A0AAN4UUF7_9RHOB|nr:Glu/Leu/Phe/Val dehydrogenase dimerization domain-containing protein [Allgaiera indica]KDB05243.1 amino acid dehydrogenase [Defluviimonas sp. 20V17]GHE05024.1 amino acid dehydrogenase [Allgaiera indica]SDX61381.1 leucine dehydrogenase [Allgaiera indica]